MDRRRLLFVLTATAALLSGDAFAQASRSEYPTKPIKLVAPYPPGGGNDLLARALAEKLQENWKQAIVVENRPGANGIVATEQVSRSAADGYSLIVGSAATHAINPSLYAKINYDPVKNFEPILQIGSTPLIITSHPSVPAKTVAELVALAKDKPNTLTYASVGQGSVGHLTGEMFQTAAGIKLVHVPYKGIAQASTELLSGDVKLAVSNIINVLQYIREGQIRAIAVTSPERLEILPDVPTVAETLSGFQATLWWGLFAPAKTPKPIIEKINRDARELLKDPATRRKWAGEGITLSDTSPDAFGAIVKDDIVRWGDAVKASGVTLN